MIILAPVAVDLTGLQVAVAYNSHISWIDLKSGTVKATCDLSVDAYDVALTTASIAYVIPRTSQVTSCSLHAIDLNTCVESQDTSLAPLYASSHVALSPSEMTLFAADQGLSPSRIDRCDLTKTPIARADSQNGADFGMHEYYGNCG